MANSGKYRSVIKIQSPVWGKDSRGGKTLTRWDDHTTTFALVRPLDGREYWQAQQANSKVSGIIETRYVAGVTTEMRVLYEDRHLHIESVYSPREKKEELHIMYREAK